MNEALKRIRKQKGMSQKECAAAAGISVTQYQNYEYGKSEPTASVLFALADHFDVSIDYLVGLSDNPNRAQPEELRLEQLQALADKLGVHVLDVIGIPHATSQEAVDAIESSTESISILEALSEKMAKKYDVSLDSVRLIVKDCFEAFKRFDAIDTVRRKRTLAEMFDMLDAEEQEKAIQELRKIVDESRGS